MIRVNKLTLEASRTPIPRSVKNLKLESLQDLSWTDPALGLREYVWWPEVDISPTLQEYQRYGIETLTPDFENKRVLVTHEVVAWTDEEIDQYEREQRKAIVPASVTKRQGRQQMILLGLIGQVQVVIEAIEDPVQRALLQSFWDDSTVYEREHLQMIALGEQIGLTEQELDEAFIAASKL